jgi:HPt (histidine-containing phosphotransfer) domain-containing protein
MTTDADPDPAALERLRAVGGDELVGRMIGLFLEHSPQRLVAARAGLRGGDWLAVERAAHSTKSSAANLGLEGFRGLAADLESAAAARDEAESDRLLRKLEEGWSALRARVEALRKR